jgi:hypothetical protein
MKKNHFKTFSLHRKPNLEQKQFNRMELQKFLRSNTKLMLLPKKLFTNKGEQLLSIYQTLFGILQSLKYLK